tara:strand:+ start:619 stop:792 length:174 start_codon:yes stop_codon:yes gene_type:complete
VINSALDEMKIKTSVYDLLIAVSALASLPAIGIGLVFFVGLILLGWIVGAYWVFLLG